MAVPHEQKTQALDRFLAEHERRAYRMAYVATGNHHDALDVVQDAMFKLVQRYAKRDAGDWPALFTRILQNCLTDFYRRSAIRRKWRQWFKPEQDEEEPLEQLAQTDSRQPDAELGRQQAMQQLDAALRGLPLRQQQVFLLRQWEGLDVAETARAMGISAGSVKTHYSRAIQSLRSQLEEYW